ncbi:nuclear transport factor 2 family protein [Sphingobacterium sp. SRCM116780]|uniref:nuclear transport factor 2 family protein n=1 Tax=Sphingobacterium sp. SRCM116780 TaxID=2907623 RepID=UPI001F16A31B|nr:nuclear transport factor 2 family protein [Sphingobacterium sp. SRCM116780]UIR54842.1 nuclear transport factor 2 family protein [Sphingobacterium sp. SRCM116780]
MKTLVKTFAMTALISLSTWTMAASKPKKEIVNLSSANLAIDHYIDVMTEGESKGVEQLFASDFNLKVQGPKLQNYNREEVLDFLKKQKGKKMNCQTTTTIMDESAHYMIARVTMKFEDFTKIDLVMLVNEGGAWKVSSSVNSYQ